jgi:hypothetical protein
MTYPVPSGTGEMTNNLSPPLSSITSCCNVTLELCKPDLGVGGGAAGIFPSSQCSCAGGLLHALPLYGGVLKGCCSSLRMTLNKRILHMEVGCTYRWIAPVVGTLVGERVS